MPIKLRGKDKLMARLNKLPKAAEKEIGNELERGVGVMYSKAVREIQRNSGNGKTYVRGGRTHTSSAPNEFPNTDTGQLISSLMYKRKGLKAWFGSALDYARYLEFGTSTMAQRPWLRPTFKDKRREIEKRINDAIKRAVNG